jgi:hypothetical protein
MITDSQIAHLQKSIKEILMRELVEEKSLSKYFFQLYTQNSILNDKEMCNDCLGYIENKLKQDNDILSNKNELLLLISILTILKTDNSFHEENQETFSVIEDILLKHAKSLINFDKVNFENGFVSILNYFGNFDSSSQELNQLLGILQEYLLWAKSERFEWSFSKGKSGVLVALINLFHKDNIHKRIYINVSDLKAFVYHQIEKITQGILPVGEITGLVTFFPTTTFNEDEDILTVSNKMTWAEGDLNQVITLYKAGYIFDNENFSKIADRVGTYTLTRTAFEDNEVDSIFIENGSAGLALTYLSLYKGTHNERYLEGYNFWKNKTLSALNENLETFVQPVNTNFMTGLLGVLLALKVFESNHKMPWMKMILL